MAVKVSAPHRTARRAISSTLTSGWSFSRAILGSGTSARYPMTEAATDFLSSLIDSLLASHRECRAARRLHSELQRI